MADQALDGNIFVYRGGIAPSHIIHAIIDQSISEIDEHAFGRCPHLQSVEFHDGVIRVKRWAFNSCLQLRQINMPGVEVIDQQAFGRCLALGNAIMPSVRELQQHVFHHCFSLEELDLPKLEETMFRTFEGCRSLRRITMPSIRTIGDGSFFGWEQLLELDLPECLERIGTAAAIWCINLRHIAIPLQRDMLIVYDATQQRYCQFDHCASLTTVDLVGGIHKTISSLHFENWRNEMKQEIYRINFLLPNDTGDKAATIQRWIQSVLRRMEHYKVCRRMLLKEVTTLLELSLSGRPSLMIMKRVTAHAQEMSFGLRQA
jgi:hypothetical protein